MVDIQKEFKLYDKFKVYDVIKGKERTVRGQKYTTDFVIQVKGATKLIAWESKGWNKRPEYKMRRKAFERVFNEDYYFVEVGSKDDAEEILKSIKKNVK